MIVTGSTSGPSIGKGQEERRSLNPYKNNSLLRRGSANFRVGDRGGGRKSLMFLLCLVGLICLTTPASAQGVGQLPTEAKIDTLWGRVNLLQERIKDLELRLEKPGFEGETTTLSRGGSHSVLKEELVSLREAVKALRRSLDTWEKRTARVQISGRERIRFMNIGTKGEQPT